MTYTMATLTTQVITDGKGQYVQASFAPNGTTIAFTCKRSGEAYYQLCLIDKSGEGYRTITRDSRDHEYPSWSPDSKRLLFFSEKGSGTAATAVIGEINLASGRERQTDAGQ